MTPKILEGYGREETLKLWKEIILSQKMQSRSGVLLFRYYKAYVDSQKRPDDAVFSIMNRGGLDALKEKYTARDVYKELGDVLEEAFANATQIDPLAHEGEKVAILIDNSGSMSNASLGLSLFAHSLILTKAIIENIGSENVKLYFWSDICEELNLSEDITFEWISKHSAANRATFVNMPFHRLIEDKIAVDKVIILTDCQMYAPGRSNETFTTYADRYKSDIAPNVKVLFWDLAGYGAGIPIKLDGDFLEISGLSDKLLSIAPKLWNDKDALVKEIEAIELENGHSVVQAHNYNQAQI